MNSPWYTTAYRRSVIDTHIPDWDERLLTRFDPEAYVANLVRAGVDSAVVYAHSHAGLCYFPTKVGRMHANLHGRNVLGEVVAGCHRAGIHVVLYVSLIYDRWASDHHPDWRMIDASGAAAEGQGRPGLVCLNSPYRDYAAALAQDLFTQVEAEGVRFDMTFWPTVCYCPHCRRRYAAEAGGEIPRTIHWTDPAWVGFQRRREAWLAEFAAHMTATARRVRPAMAVEHQASTYTLSWVLGVTDALVPHNDYLEGDFYGDALQGSFVRKLFLNLSPAQPYGFETSICLYLHNHTAVKSRDLLRAKAFAAVADQGAFIFIDGIDPAGTLSPAKYALMGEIFAETRAYDVYRGGELCQDVAIYFSMLSKYDPATSGQSVQAPDALSWAADSLPHVSGSLRAAAALVGAHIPYGVISRPNLDRLDRHRVLVLSNVLVMDDKEAEAIRAWVRQGGLLYASEQAGLGRPDGRVRDDFPLADVLGVSYRGWEPVRPTYMAPAADAADRFPGYAADYPLSLPTGQVMVDAAPGTRVLATMTLPYSYDDPRTFASIWSSPPERATARPSVTLHRYGEGWALYAAGQLERCPEHEAVFLALLRRLADDFSCSAEAPRAVEVTVFRQPERGRLLVYALNFQRDLPNIPVEGIRLSLRMEGVRPRRVFLAPGEQAVPFTVESGRLHFTFPRLETFALVVVEYERIGIPHAKGGPRTAA